MRRDIELAFDNLYETKVSDFINKRLSLSLCESLSIICEAYNMGSSAERKDIRKHVRFNISFLFFMFSGDMAEQAIRTQSYPALTAALVALGVEDCTFDSRDSTVALSLVFHSAKKLGADVNELFPRIAAISGPRSRRLFFEFLKREPTLQAISAFGFSEGNSGGAFAYVPKEK